MESVALIRGPYMCLIQYQKASACIAFGIAVCYVLTLMLVVDSKGVTEKIQFLRKFTLGIQINIYTVDSLQHTDTVYRNSVINVIHFSSADQ